MLVDKTVNKEVSVFVNNQHVRTLSLGWGNEGNGTYADTNTGADVFVRGDSNAKTNEVNKVALYNFTSNIPADIVLADSDGKNYTIFDNDVPVDIGSVTLKYEDAFAEGTDVSGAKLYAKGEDGNSTLVSGYTAALSEDMKSIVISKEDGILPSGTYVISVSGVSGATDFTTEFVVNDSRSLVIDSFDITKDETGYYPSMSAKNYGAEKAVLTVIICEYSNDNVPKLLNIKFKSIELSGGESVTTGSTTTDLVLTATGNDTSVKAFVWNKLGENVPLVGAVKYGE